MSTIAYQAISENITNSIKETGFKPFNHFINTENNKNKGAILSLLANKNDKKKNSLRTVDSILKTSNLEYSFDEIKKFDELNNSLSDISEFDLEKEKEDTSEFNSSEDESDDSEDIKIERKERRNFDRKKNYNEFENEIEKEYKEILNLLHKEKKL
jgi:hypothetical protein